MGLFEVFDAVGYSEKATQCPMLIGSTCLRPDSILVNLTSSTSATSLVVGRHYFTQSFASVLNKV